MAIGAAVFGTLFMWGTLALSVFDEGLLTVGQAGVLGVIVGAISGLFVDY